MVVVEPEGRNGALLGACCGNVRLSKMKGVECLLCVERFSKQAIEEGKYFIETLICSECYVTMQQAPHALHCFGKPTEILENNQRLLGYNPKAEECELFCPDRNICRKVVLCE